MSEEPDIHPHLLIAALQGPSPRYKREELEAIATHPAETTPLLLERLGQIVQDLPAYAAAIGDDDLELIYILTLFAHFREAAAHDLVVRLACGPPDTLDFLLGDLVSERLDAIMLLTSAGRTDGFRAIVQDRNADGYIRSQAADALVMAVYLGHAERLDVLEFLAGKLHEDEVADERNSFFWTGVALAMLRLHPVEYAEVLDRAYDEELLDDSMFGTEGMGEFLEDAEREAAELAANVRTITERTLHEWMSWWACFREEERQPTRRSSALQALRALAEQAQKEAAKQKKDANKKARKKQRAARKKQGRKRR